jgi:isoleucyl-tRNA synthetase
LQRQQKKMSKRLKNYPARIITDKYGVDVAAVCT